MEIFFSCFQVAEGMWKWTGYEVLFASITHHSLALLYVVNTHSLVCFLCMSRRTQTVPLVACAMAPNWILRLVNVLFHFCSYPKQKPMEDVPDVAYGEAFTLQHGGEDTGAESERGDVSIDLPVEGDADLSMLVEQKNGNKTVVHIDISLN